MTRSVFGLEVLDDGNTILGERLTRSLRAELNKINGVAVEFADSGVPAPAGAKGGALADPALWLFLGPAAEATAGIVIETIKAWSERERNRAIRLTKGSVSVELDGKTDKAQERIIRKFLEGEDS